MGRGRSIAPARRGTTAITARGRWSRTLHLHRRALSSQRRRKTFGLLHGQRAGERVSVAAREQDRLGWILSRYRRANRSAFQRRVVQVGPAAWLNPTPGAFFVRRTRVGRARTRATMRGLRCCSPTAFFPPPTDGGGARRRASMLHFSVLRLIAAAQGSRSAMRRQRRRSRECSARASTRAFFNPLYPARARRGNVLASATPRGVRRIGWSADRPRQIGVTMPAMSAQNGQPSRCRVPALSEVPRRCRSCCARRPHRHGPCSLRNTSTPRRSAIIAHCATPAVVRGDGSVPPRRCARSARPIRPWS